MSQAAAMLGLVTETSLHAGAGSSVGAIDLPVQREGHNGWPCVFGSAVKGALRSRAEEVLKREQVFAVFGPDTANASENAGAIATGDARLLCLAVRSLTSSFRWVTCPEALKRLKRDVRRLGLNSLIDVPIPSVAGHEAKSVEGQGDLFLEEYRFSQVSDEQVEALIPALATLLEREDAAAELKTRLVVVADDLFTHLAANALPVNAHIALDSASKTTIPGALWYEETLPPESLLYVPIVATNARREKVTLESQAVLQLVTDLFSQRPWIQLGGNETVGMGWCAVSVVTK